MFGKVLVANRGEIATRITRTLREMGIRSVAVYSDADTDSPHAAMADEAVNIGGPGPADSYLDADRLVQAAVSTGCDAVHPGYGFLSESPAFARAVEAAGMVFIGPPPHVLELAADKAAARRQAQETGVPVVPGTFLSTSDPASLAEQARGLGFPLLVKAAMGGGGKGMRAVESPSGIEQASILASGEAEAAFGDGSIYLEKLLDRPRHIEVQFVADTAGNMVHLLERECSLQLRNQKLVEETPSPALDPDQRDAICEAAVMVAGQVGYVGAGTVEFLLDRGGTFHFLEVNARLQVEHPVTEMCTGIDLVRVQLEIAAGMGLRFGQGDVVHRGHAIECRIYAKDPLQDFSPSPGRILLVREPSGPGVRVDSGIEAGTDVPIQYDPLLAKLSVHAGNRDGAVARAIRALEEYAVLGTPTPIEFMIALLGSDSFRSGEYHVGSVEDFLAQWTPDPLGDRMAAIGYDLEMRAGEEREGGPGPSPESPWTTLNRWGR